MAVSVPTRVAFEINGVPPNWANQRLHHMQKHQQMRPWRETAKLAAHSARNRHRLPLSVDEKRTVVITLFKCGNLFDPDGSYSAVKPVVDGLIGALIVDDKPRYLDLLVKQEKVEHRNQQRTLIEVFV